MDLSSGPKGKDFLHPVCGPRIYFIQPLIWKTEISPWLFFGVTVNSSIFYVPSKRGREPESCLLAPGWRRHREGRARAPRDAHWLWKFSLFFSVYSNISVHFIFSNHSLPLSSALYLSEEALWFFA